MRNCILRIPYVCMLYLYIQYRGGDTVRVVLWRKQWTGQYCTAVLAVALYLLPWAQGVQHCEWNNDVANIVLQSLQYLCTTNYPHGPRGCVVLWKKQWTGQYCTCTSAGTQLKVVPTAAVPGPMAVAYISTVHELRLLIFLVSLRVFNEWYMYKYNNWIIIIIVMRMIAVRND